MINFAARPLRINKFALFEIPIQRSVGTRTINLTILSVLEGMFVYYARLSIIIVLWILTPCCLVDSAQTFPSRPLHSVPNAFTAMSHAFSVFVIYLASCLSGRSQTLCGVRLRRSPHTTPIFLWPHGALSGSRKRSVKDQMGRYGTRE